MRTFSFKNVSAILRANKAPVLCSARNIFISWFNSYLAMGSSSNRHSSEEEGVEISLNTLGVAFALGLGVLGIVYYLIDSSTFSNNPPPGTSGPITVIDSFIEENYFEEHGLLNPDFSNGLVHWSTSDGTAHPGSRVKLILNTKESHSSPGSLQLECESEENCRVHYDKQERSGFVDYDPKSSMWLGVDSPKNVILSFWYKGCTQAVYVLTLNSYGSFVAIRFDSLSDKCSDGWKPLEGSKKLPEDTRAIGLEITTSKHVTLLIDDVNIRVE